MQSLGFSRRTPLSGSVRAQCLAHTRVRVQGKRSSLGPRPPTIIGNSPKFSRVVVDSITYNSTKAIVKATLEEAVAADTRSLSGKTVQSPEGNVDVETPSSMDDSSMILIEIGVDVDEGPRPNMMIGSRAQSSVHPR